MRSQTDQLREALIGSVSHELRTPLASILGAATVLSAAPALANEKKLKALVHDVRDEAERLNNDIQNLLDATRISQRRHQAAHRMGGPRRHRQFGDRALPPPPRRPPPRARSAGRSAADPCRSGAGAAGAGADVRQRGEIFRAGSQITVAARARDGRMVVSVSDEGAGMTAAEQTKIWERFARGERHAATTSGSGLGLWIANAFIAANGGKINAVSDGPRSGHHGGDRTAGDASRRPATGKRRR